MRIIRVIALAGLLSLVNGASASAQFDARSPGQQGATYGLRPLPPPVVISSSQNADVMRHRDPAGKPCLTVGGMARPRTPSSNLYDHVVIATNTCAQAIKLQVCYYKSQQCVAMEVQGRKPKEAVLGLSLPAKDFRYEFREKF